MPADAIFGTCAGGVVIGNVISSSSSGSFLSRVVILS